TEILDSEFQWISRESDVLIRANSPDDGEFLILNELQLRYNNTLPRRMLAYSALAIEKYNLPVYPVLINILPPSQNPNIPNQYSATFKGLQTRQDYRVINLWEIEARLVFEQSLLTLIPFVPILQGGSSEATVREAVRVLRTDSQLSELENLLAFFATFVLETEVVQQIMRWDMAVLMESPWYRQIVEESEKRGEARGRQIGLREGLLLTIEMALKLRFGEAGLALMPEIRQIEDINLLERLCDVVETVESPQAFRRVYRNE
ncbi:MAG: Rpn family recombination-promoting nuclease/putative transposase, partial [Spirulinaceae cyanobacterium]